MAKGDGETGAITRDRHHRLLRLAGRQLNLVSLEQLYGLGFTYESVRWMVRQGRLYRIHHNVFAVGTPHIVPRAHLLGAQLSLGPSAFLSHRSAAAVRDLRPVNTHAIELTVPGTGGRHRDGITIHRTKHPLHPADIKTSGLFRVSSVMRMLIELSPREPADELGRLVTVAVQRRLLRPDAKDGLADIEAALARHKGWPGMPELAAVLAAYLRTESHKSQLELAFDRLLAQHPDIPDPQRNVYIDVWEIDRFWPERRLAVELDGRPYHMAVRDMEKDRIKDAALQRLAITPLRFTDLRFETDVAGILGDLRHFLGAG